MARGLLERLSCAWRAPPHAQIALEPGDVPGATTGWPSSRGLRRWRAGGQVIGKSDRLGAQVNLSAFDLRTWPRQSIMLWASIRPPELRDRLETPLEALFGRCHDSTRRRSEPERSFGRTLIRPRVFDETHSAWLADASPTRWWIRSGLPGGGGRSIRPGSRLGRSKQRATGIPATIRQDFDSVPRLPPAAALRAGGVISPAAESAYYAKRIARRTPRPLTASGTLAARRTRLCSDRFVQRRDVNERHAEYNRLRSVGGARSS